MSNCRLDTRCRLTFGSGVKTGRVTKKKVLATKVKRETQDDDDMLLDGIIGNGNEFSVGDDGDSMEGFDEYM